MGWIRTVLGSLLSRPNGADGDSKVKLAGLLGFAGLVLQLWAPDWWEVLQDPRIVQTFYGLAGVLGIAGLRDLPVVNGKPS